jgi:hypothetical protein
MADPRSFAEWWPKGRPLPVRRMVSTQWPCFEPERRRPPANDLDVPPLYPLRVGEVEATMRRVIEWTPHEQGKLVFAIFLRWPARKLLRCAEWASAVAKAAQDRDDVVLVEDDLE